MRVNSHINITRLSTRTVTHVYLTQGPTKIAMRCRQTVSLANSTPVNVKRGLPMAALQLKLYHLTLPTRGNPHIFLVPRDPT